MFGNDPAPYPINKFWFIRDIDLLQISNLGKVSKLDKLKEAILFKIPEGKKPFI